MFEPGFCRISLSTNLPPRHLARQVGGQSSSPSTSTSTWPTRDASALRRAGRVLTEPVANGNRRVRAGAATEPAAGEEQASSLHPSVQAEPPARTAAASSLARHDPPAPQAALLMARELLRYRPTEAGYDAWLARITELINAAGDTPAPSRPLPPPSPRGGRAGHGAPPPPPPTDDGAGHHRGARTPEPSHGASSPHHADASCQIARRAALDARVILEQQRDRQNRTIQDVAAAGRQNRAALAVASPPTVGVASPSLASYAAWCGP